MKTATIIENDHEIFALEIDGHWFDFSRMLNAYSMQTSGLPTTEDMTLEEWVKHGLLWADKMSAIVTSLIETHTLDDFIISEPKNFKLPFRPGKIICVGRNYAAHAKELGNEIPENPLIFEKLPSICIGDGEAIKIDPQWGRIDYEGELALVIGKEAKDVSVNEGTSYVCGYTLLNDVTARDIQSEAKKNGHPWLMAKNKDTFCPFGPAITLTDSITEPNDLTITLKVNGELRQQGHTGQFIFSIGEMISWISAHITLEPGDLIATGTPEGVGFLAIGDKIELENPEIGVLHNEVKGIFP